MAVGVEESLALRIREGANEAGHLTHRPKQVAWKCLKVICQRDDTSLYLVS